MLGLGGTDIHHGYDNDILQREIFMLIHLIQLNCKDLSCRFFGNFKTMLWVFLLPQHFLPLLLFLFLS